MQSSFGILPSSRQVISTVPIPIVITVQPLTKDATILPANYRPPRCSRCGAYLSPNCPQSKKEWRCAVCGHLMKMPRGPIPNQTTQVAELLETPEVLPLRHSLIVFLPIEKSMIAQYLAALPPRCPVRLITSPDPNENVPDGMACQILKELDSIPFPSKPIPFAVAENAIVSLLGDYNAQGNLDGPWWCRIFVETPPRDAVTSPLLTFVQKQRSEHVRIDFYFVGQWESALVTSLVHDSPGVSKLFQPLNEVDIPDLLLPDAKREFAFQAQVKFLSGPSYSARFLPSVYLTSWESRDCVMIPVLPSDTAPLSFELTPPDVEDRSRYQGLQCVVKLTKWNPITNRVSQKIRIVSADFAIGSSLPALIDSIKPTLVFHAWVRAAQNLSMRDMQFVIPAKLKAIAPIVLEHESLHPIVRLAFLVKSHTVLCTIFHDRLTMGSLLSLSPPNAMDAQFSYTVEVWSGFNTLVASGLRVEPKLRKGNYMYVIKSFPNLFVVSKTGNVLAEPGSEMEKSIEAFREACKPLAIRVVPTTLFLTGDLMTVDEEEDLPKFLKDTDLEAVPLEPIFGISD